MSAVSCPLRILVVEDDADTAESTSLLLRTLGHSSRAALSGQTALEEAPAFHPDLMLIDLAMPALDGCELVNRLRLMPDFCQTPLIAVSGYVDVRYRQQALDAGFDGFLSKPFSKGDLETLISRVQSVLMQTNAAIEESRERAEAARQTIRKSRESLDEHWLNRQRRSDS
jgi:CheY-like chemotaxis protein